MSNGNHTLMDGTSMQETQIETKTQKRPLTTFTKEQRAAWHEWFVALLISRRYATIGPDGKPHYLLADLYNDILRQQPDSPVAKNTLRSIVYYGSIPEHPTAKGLAAALGISELAILLHSGQLDMSAILPLLGTAPQHLWTPQEYADALAELPQQIPNAAYRERMRQVLEHEAAYSQWLENTLEWLGISQEEWQELRAALNTPEGRNQLRRDMGYDAPEAEEMNLPAEYLDTLESE